jgi:hypothetical protein
VVAELPPLRIGFLQDPTPLSLGQLDKVNLLCWPSEYSVDGRLRVHRPEVQVATSNDADVARAGDG